MKYFAHLFKGKKYWLTAFLCHGYKFPITNLFFDRAILSRFHKHLQKETVMKKDVKKLLAGLGVASLIGAGGVALPGAHAAGSG